MSSETEKKFSCVVIGDGTLPIRCSEILLENGHHLRAVCSTDDKVKKWAKEGNVATSQSIPELLSQLGDPVDYVFSIVNEHILRDDILTLPSKGTINYHDGPLPRYAGTHATSWAILNHERSHAITWHFVTDVVDAGDILKQERVEIADNETAHSLNTKCYEAAIRAFCDLVFELSNDCCQPTKQNLAERTFFPRFKRPVGGGVISWRSSSRDISALIRALNFGPHPNPLGTAKLAIDDTFVIVSEVESSNRDAESTPGTINEIGSDFIRVSTCDREIFFRAFLRLDGRPVSVSQLTIEFGLKIGYRFPELKPEDYDRIETAINDTCRSERYWVKRLSELNPVAAPFADSSSSLVAAKHEMVQFTLPGEFVNFVERNSSAHSLSLHVVAAFGAFLSRLTDSEHFDVGLQDARIHPDLSGIDQLFVKLLPLRLLVDWEKNFLRQLDSTAIAMELVRSNKIFGADLTARYPEISPSNAGPNVNGLPACIFLGDVNENQVEPVGDLTLLIRNDRPDCLLFFDLNKFRENGAENFVKCFSIFLEGIAAGPDRRLAELPLLDAEQSRLLTVELFDDRLNVPDESCVHHLFEAQARLTPESIALIVGDQRYTYRELDQISNGVATRLRNLGVRAEVLVAICVTRSVKMVAGILGVLKAGGAYVPLDPAYPKGRLDQILQDSGVAILLTESDLSDNLDTQDVLVINLDTDMEFLANTLDVSDTKPNNLAYVIYTSGSTGIPKGVAIEHRSVVTFLTWATSVFDLEKLKGTVASTSICFDLSIFELFAPLTCGGTVILIENILQLPFAPAAKEATLLNTVPSAITELLRMNGVPNSVRTINLAGEPLKTSLVNQIYRATNVLEVFDLYGPTEDTTYSTYTLRKGGKATIGRPISNTQVYVLDRNLELLPPGIPGELYLGGDGLAREYLNRPDLTASRFIKNPFDCESSSRIYRTGDLVRYLPSFDIEYLGRVDNQVKIRGFRIELGEIEAVLSTHPAVEGVTVMAREDHSSVKRLVAYFVTSGAHKVGANELREHVRRSLPDFMVPAIFVELDEFPLTPNGKVDRKSLPEPSHALAEDNASYLPPRNKVESELVGIWERLLNVSPIGIRDDFFGLGGDSLVSVSLFVEIENQFGIELPLSALVGSPTIEKLADAMTKRRANGSSKYLVPLQTEGERTALFCMHAAGGNVLFYRDLAGELGKDQPFYGLQARGVTDKSETAHDRVEEMARDYLKEIRGLQPTGPYNLCGASFGGLVAFEAARQLVASGEKVGTLAVFDTYAPGYVVAGITESKSYPLKALVFRVRSVRDQLREMGDWKKRLDFVLSKAAKVKKKVKRKIAWTKNQFAIEYNKATGRDLPPDMMRNHAAIQKAMDTYIPKKFDGDMIIFRASEQPTAEFDPHLGWDRYVAGKVNAIVVKGTHGALTVYPFATDLAAKLKPFLLEEAVSDRGVPQRKRRRAASMSTTA